MEWDPYIATEIIHFKIKLSFKFLQMQMVQNIMERTIPPSKNNLIEFTVKKIIGSDKGIAKKKIREGLN